MKNLRIAQKLIVGFSSVILLFLALVTYQLVQQSSLAQLQDEGIERAEGVQWAVESAAMGYKAYQVIADAIINKDLTQSNVLWENIKSDAENDFAMLSDILDTQEEHELFGKAKNQFATLITIYEQEMLPLLNADASIEQVREIDAKIDEQVELMQPPLSKIVALLEIENSEADELYDSTASRVQVVSIIISILAILFAIAAISILLNLIVVPLKRAVSFAQEIAEGSLTANLEIDQKDEVGILAAALKEMREKLKGIISEVVNGANSIASASQQMSSSSQVLSQGASEQASGAEEVSSSMEEMAANIQQNTDNAQQAEKTSLSVSNGVQKVGSASKESLESVRNIAQKISVINDIAFQTNILALNAAVEAARAGEHGRGFAVVAAEVRKLAERSKIAADEIVSLASKSVNATESAGDLMGKLIPEIEKTAKLVQEIAAASIEQASGADQVNTSIQQLNLVTQQNATASEEMSTSAEELSAQAEQLKDIVSFFTTDNRGNERHGNINQLETNGGLIKENTVKGVKLGRLKV